MFEFGGVTLRPIEECDLRRMVELRADPKVWLRLGDISMISLKAQQEWFESLLMDEKRRYFALETAEISFLGIVRIDELDWINRSARIGGDILPAYQGRGYGKMMFTNVTKYCFDFLNLHRLWLFVIENNEAAIGLYLKSGFTEEGRQRKAIFRDGVYFDYIMMSLLRDEWVAIG